MLIYHILEEAVWKHAILEGEYHAASLETEGFMHCSTKEQVLESASIHFKAHTELMVIEIVSKRVKDLLKWELGRNEELFPHIYGSIPIGVVETTHGLLKDKMGNWDWV